MIKQCIVCGAEFKTIQCRVDKGCGKYCSIKCRIEDKKASTTKCKVCGTEFKVYPSRILQGRGTYCSYGCRDKEMKSEQNPNWKGDEAGYFAIHWWVRQHKPKPEFCEECNASSPTEISNISGKCLRDINDYKWLCKSCHRKKDGTIFNVKSRRAK